MFWVSLIQSLFLLSLFHFLLCVKGQTMMKSFRIQLFSFVIKDWKKVEGEGVRKEKPQAVIF